MTTRPIQKETENMKSNIKEIPIAHESLGEMVRGQDWGGMTSAYMEYPAGLDFTPLLEGLENNYCQCPHWGFVIEGRILVTYQDGSQETVEAGQLYYWPSGHTILVEEAVRMVEFSPHEDMMEVLGNVVGNL
jgi:mannose-6-phosphate isomerase-like protein (cupin superfamily)